MPSTRRGSAELARDSSAALRDVVARSPVTRGWDALQDRDADGNAKAARPYTDAALALFDAAYRERPDDDGIVHHLAIARHARAWDLELAGDPRAAGEWERALGHWRHLASSGPFWQGLRGKLALIDPAADAGVLDTARRELLVNLLEIHVDFVRHYCEAGTIDRAATHIEIVRRAQIPPAAKKRLIGLVFEALTSGAADAKAAGAFDSALTTVERFLALFDDYLPALRMHAEISREAVGALSYERWDDVRALAERAEAPARRLAEHGSLGDDPLARTALHELAAEIALKCRDRGGSFAPKHEDAPVRIRDREGERGGFDLGLSWCRVGWPASPAESRVRILFGLCAEGYAFSLHREVMETAKAAEKPGADVGAHMRAAERLYRRALALLEEAQHVEPDCVRHRENLQAVKRLISQVDGSNGL